MKSFATLTALTLLCFVAAGCGEAEEGATTDSDTTPSAVDLAGAGETATETAASTDAADGEVILVAVNANCPMNKEGATDGATTEFDGKTVGFCCDKCKAAWEEKTDEEKTAALAAVMKPETATTTEDAGT